jgi:hypothetical protein
VHLDLLFTCPDSLLSDVLPDPLSGQILQEFSIEQGLADP